MQVQHTLASFSSAGPTYEGFVKPEVVGMGGHVKVAYSPSNGCPATNSRSGTTRCNDDFTMSGTPPRRLLTVSGVVALMLQVSPFLTPRNERQVPPDVGLRIRR